MGVQNRVHVSKFDPVKATYDEGIHSTRMFYSVADMAVEFAKHFAIVAATPDGEDSAGRAKLRLSTPAEVVQRSCDIAEGLWNEFESRGWMFEVPLPKGAEDVIAAVREYAERIREARKPL